MREIKFRAWFRGKIREVQELYYYTSEVWVGMKGLDSMHKAVLMQYTGLKDKNGTEIYESDIVMFSGSLAKHTTKVVYDAPEFMFEDIKSGARLSAARVSDIRISQFNPQQYEVIGNIYENKELLK